jgi:hypothetical protein
MTCFTSSIVRARRDYMEVAQQTRWKSCRCLKYKGRPLVINRTNQIIQENCLVVQEKG